MKRAFDPPTSKDLSQSARLYKAATRYAPGGVHSSFRLAMNPFPLFFSRTQGSRQWDVDGNEYVDYALGMGPVILGHANPEVNEAVKASLAQGQLFGGQHEEELLLAQTICELVPCAEQVRFALSGSEAVQAALRLVRAATGRQEIIKFEGHYHGWFDNIAVSVHPDEGRMGPDSQPRAVPMSFGQFADTYARVHVSSWNDLELFTGIAEGLRGRVAAVILEPILCNTSVIPPKPGFLEKVREICQEQGIILIFDEVITGFRVGLGGAQDHLKIRPDLAVFAKAMANGYPASCVAGRRDLMETLSNEAVTQGGTYSGNRISCVAALATLRALRKNGGEAYVRLGRAGTALINGLRKLAAETGQPLHVQGLPSVFHTTFTDQKEITDYRSYRRCRLDLQSRFVSLLLQRGVRITGRGTWFLSAAHTEKDVEFTLKAVRGALRELKER